jgi:hypothetical protein
MPYGTKCAWRGGSDNACGAPADFGPSVTPETGDVNWFCRDHWMLLKQLVSFGDETCEGSDTT